MVASLSESLGRFHCFILYLSATVIAGLYSLNWCYSLNRMNINININDPKMNINQYQDNTLGHEIKVYYDYNGRVMAYVMVFVYIVNPTIQLLLRYICLYFKLSQRKRFILLFTSTVSTVSSLFIPYSSLVQAIASNGNINNKYGSIHFGFENKIGTIIMYINTYLSYSFGIYLLYLHCYKSNDTKHNHLNELNQSIIINASINNYDEKNKYDSILIAFMYRKKGKIYCIFPFLLLLTLALFIYSQFIIIFKGKWIGYLVDFGEDSVDFSAPEIELTAYDVYDKYIQYAYYDNDNFITSKAMVWIISIIYLFGNILLPIWVLILLIFLWFCPFKRKDMNKFNILWHIILLWFVSMGPFAFITITSSLVIFQKQVTTQYFYSQFANICQQFGDQHGNHGICIAKETYFTDNIILYLVSIVLIVHIIIITYKSVSVFKKTESLK